jgi:hypothetical protein
VLLIPIARFVVSGNKEIEKRRARTLRPLVLEKRASRSTISRPHFRALRYGPLN